MRHVPYRTNVLAVVVLAAAAVSIACSAPTPGSATTATAKSNGVVLPTTVAEATATAPPGTRAIFVSDLTQLNSTLGGLRFSPDGSKILGHSIVALTPTGSALSSPMISDSDGGNLRLVDDHAIVAEWAPDSKAFAMTISDGSLSSEHEKLPLFVVNADNLSRQQIGFSDFPRYLQFLQNGDLAHVQEGQLNIWHSATNTDEVVSSGAAITGSTNGIPNDAPFLVSEDERFVAISHDGTLSVQDLGTSAAHVLSSNLNSARESGYAWSPVGHVLAYAHTDERRQPSIHLYDASSGADTPVGTDSLGCCSITPMEWTPDGAWLIFILHDSGTEYPYGDISAINAATGEVTPLVKDAIYFYLYDSGHKLWLYRFGKVSLPQSPDERWTATLTYQ